ncbi:MAG: PrgI family protein [Clostridia bacterium]|nr:PrgI family protein [Clostridia bacterium]
MQTYEIPRDYRGEGRILYIFSTKGLIYTAVGAAIGLIFYFIFKLIKLTVVGIVITLIFALIGFCIGTFKMPDNKKFSITQKTGGEKIDDVIMRYIRFKQKKNRIYVSIKEEPKDE